MTLPIRLLVIRHAVAMDRDEYQSEARHIVRASGRRALSRDLEYSDDFRPLTDEGVRKMRKNVKGLRQIVKKPDFLVSSPLTRALQTAEVLRETWSALDVASTDFLRPGSDPEDLVKWLSAQPQCENANCLVALVGHEPHLSSFVSWLMNGSRKSQIILKKGGACLIEFPGGLAKGKGQLSWLASPSMLRKLAH